MKLYSGDKVTLIDGGDTGLFPEYILGDTLTVDYATAGNNGYLIKNATVPLGFHISWVQPCLYVYRSASHCPEHRLWAEVCLGEPVHTADLPQRIRDLRLGGTFATMSDTVLQIIGWMVRKGEIKCPLTMIYTDADGKETEHRMATDDYLFSKGDDDA